MPAAEREVSLELPPKLIPVFSPERGESRYRCAFGGRGSGKSYSFALMAAVWGYMEPMRILATRDLQTSIKESFYAEVKRAIEETPWLAPQYDIGQEFIRGKNGTEFLFRGLRHNMASIKSTAHIDLCIVEEAEDIPENAWIELLPTIRAPRSEVWVIWNPRLDGSPVDKRFRKNNPPRSLIAELQYWDNPWFPEVLEEDRQFAEQVMDPCTYAWIWEGQYRELSDAQILARKIRVAEFEPDPRTWNGPYHGLDYGFARDPTACTRCWVHDNRLYVERECGGVGIELDDTAKILLDEIPDAHRYVIRADAARPESSSHLRRHGLPMTQSAPKWQGSVDDGIAHLQSYREIVIHPRCRETIKEGRMYAWKVDRLTGDILPVPVDAYNHYIDSIRYALAPLIQATTYTLENL